MRRDASASARIGTISALFLGRRVTIAEREAWAREHAGGAADQAGPGERDTPQQPEGTRRKPLSLFHASFFCAFFHTFYLTSVPSTARLPAIVGGINYEPAKRQ